MSDSTEFFYDNRVCPECGGHQKNCEHFWAGHVIGQKLGAMEAERRIIKLLEDPTTMSNWWAMPDKSLGLYGNLKNYVIALIKGESQKRTENGTELAEGEQE